jgi:hypothetical protein
MHGSTHRLAMRRDHFHMVKVGLPVLHTSGVVSCTHTCAAPFESGVLKARGQLRCYREVQQGGCS